MASSHPFPPDPLIDEVRERRRHVLQQFGNDLDQLFAELREREKQHPEKMINLRERRKKR